MEHLADIFNQNKISSETIPYVWEPNDGRCDPTPIEVVECGDTTYAEISQFECPTHAMVGDINDYVLHFDDVVQEDQEADGDFSEETDEEEVSFGNLINLMSEFQGTQWAKEFRKMAIKSGYSDMPEEWLAVWFACAIMTGYETGYKQGFDNQVEDWHQSSWVDGYCAGMKDVARCRNDKADDHAVNSNGQIANYGYISNSEKFDFDIVGQECPTPLGVDLVSLQKTYYNHSGSITSGE